MKYIIIFVYLFVFSSFLSSKDLSSVLDVFHRVAPWMDGHVRVENLYVDDEDVMDAYELSMNDEILLIRATSIPAAGMGFNYYLKYFCNRNISLCGTNLDPVDSIPVLKEKIYHSTTAKYRHLFNFCTQNYSASFWEWADWERMVDFMVLNGVNLTLSTLGLEKVWYNTLLKLNFSQSEIFSFLPGPAFNAWHMMANLEGWGGPITLNMVEKRSNLQKKLLNRLRAYEIEPIYMSFYGMVPIALKDKFPNANIIPQGKWAGGFVRPSILSPLDPLYSYIADIYYGEVKNNYGEFNFFAGEPFHEGGIREGIDASQLSKIVLNKMREYNPKAQWVLQAWSNNPTSEFLSSLSKNGDVLIWDFRGELSAEWEERRGYEGYPFLWGVINNFGETPGLYGRLDRFVHEYFRAKNSLYSSNMNGLGVSPEGIMNNPINFDLLYEIPWHENEFNVEDWIVDYVTYRYGSKNMAMLKVWNILLETAYSSETDVSKIEPISKKLPSIVGNPESLICAPPSLDLKSASSWGSSFVFYDSEKMKTLVPFLLQAIKDLKTVDAFGYDVVNITRQLLSNEFKQKYYEYQICVANKDLKGVKTNKESMLLILDDLDLLLSSRKEFMVGAWLDKAKKYGATYYEKKICEWNARSLITYWGPESVDTDLRDYSHKEWSGLIKDVYKKRWVKFFEEVERQICDKIPVSNNYLQISIDWSNKTDMYPCLPIYDEFVVSEKILKKISCNIY